MNPNEIENYYTKFPIAYQSQERAIFWENFLTDEEITVLLSLPEWLSAVPAGVGNSDEYDFTVRRSKIGWLNDPDAKTKAIMDKINNVFAHVNHKFFRYDLTIIENAQLTYYSSEKQDTYDWHVDYHLNNNDTLMFLPSRKLSMSLLLNDTNQFEGGQLELKMDTDIPFECEQKKGRAWFFPSYMLHRVTPVTKGHRRSLVMWACGPSFK